MRRLPYSVPQLVEHSPFSFDDPNRVFVGSKETSIIEIDLDNGVIDSVMSGGKTWTKDDADNVDPDIDSGNSEWDDGEIPNRKKKKKNRGRIVQIGRTGQLYDDSYIRVTDVRHYRIHD